MQPPTRLRTAVTAALVLAALTGCGGDDDDDSEPAGTTGTSEEQAALSKSEFIRQADAICAEADEDLEPLEERIDRLGPSEFAELASTLREGLVIAAREIADLRELPPPRGDADIVDKTLGTIEDQLAVLRRLADAAEREDEKAIEALAEELARGTERAQGLAEGYGFKECGSGGG